MAKFTAQNQYERNFYDFLNPFVTQETVGAFGATFFCLGNYAFQYV